MIGGGAFGDKDLKDGIQVKLNLISKVPYYWVMGNMDISIKPLTNQSRILSFQGKHYLTHSVKKTKLLFLAWQLFG